VFDRYEEDWGRLGWVLVRGRASVLEGGPFDTAQDRPEQERALAALREKYPQYRSMALEGRPLIRIEVEKVSSWGALG